MFITPAFDDKCFGYETPPSGFSFIEKVYEKIFKNTTDCSAIKLQEKEALRALDEVFFEYSIENWDGYDAKPLSQEAYFEAQKFLQLMPSYLPLPRINPEADGEIDLEWYKNNKCLFAISLGGNNILTFAGIFGETNNIHGTEAFVDAIPATIITYIKRAVG